MSYSNFVFVLNEMNIRFSHNYSRLIEDSIVFLAVRILLLSLKSEPTDIQLKLY